MAIGEDHRSSCSHGLQPPGGGWDLMCKPEVVGPALERAKEGNRDRGEIETDRDIKRKTETNGYTER